MRIWEQKPVQNNNPMGFKTGQLVQLKSGGPHMTIAGIAYNGLVFCKWFNNGALEGARFEPSAIQRCSTKVSAKARAKAKEKARDKPAKSQKSL
jgi:uncharacterized protein YodC (DUF2158 family)